MDFDQTRTRTVSAEKTANLNHANPFSTDTGSALERSEAEPLTRDEDPKNIATYPAERGSQVQSGDYSQMLYDTPPCGTPASSISDNESTHNHVENITPPESPKPDSPGAISTANMGRLSLENHESAQPLENIGDAGAPDLPLTTASKRAASSDLPQLKRQSLMAPSPKVVAPARKFRLHSAKPSRLRGHTSGRYQYGRNPGASSNDATTPGRWPRNKFEAIPRDSGYESGTGKGNALYPTENTIPSFLHQSESLPRLDEQPQGEISSFPSSTKERYPGLLLQPESSPISKDQLAAEVKGIYAGLVMVEAKCINIDAAQANDPHSQLGPEQWQALIALHRTLLYEHHDFLMATQHPSATPALRGLASKYSMPARMWRHGIHAFLEVLRHRRPDSQDYMLAFIYLVYQMMALLFETVPTFTDTWIECLGDLARYRMAIEEEREAHSIWGGVAGRWYNLASDRHPAIGRLYHHLGILERPSLRKLFLYAKSLTCVAPFQNARDSLATLCTPIAQEHSLDKGNLPSAEARIVAFHALIFSGSDNATTSRAASDALLRLSQQSPSKTREIGVELVVSNVASLLELGSTWNVLWQRYSKAITEDIRNSRPSATGPGPPVTTDANSQHQVAPDATRPSSCVIDFCTSAFNVLIRLGSQKESISDVLPSLHAILVWIHSLIGLQSRTDDEVNIDTDGLLLNAETFSWGGLCEFLNLVAQLEPISARTIAFARQGMFLTAERTDDTKPLPEDFLIRGLIWTQFYFPPTWFSKQSDDDGRALETPDAHKARCERVHWLGLCLAFRVQNLKFDTDTKRFYTTLTKPSPPSKYILPNVDARKQDPIKEYFTASPPTATFSARSGSECATTTSPKSEPLRTWAKVASKPTKVRSDYSAVKVFDEDSIEGIDDPICLQP